MGGRVRNVRTPRNEIAVVVHGFDENDEAMTRVMTGWHRYDATGPPGWVRINVCDQATADLLYEHGRAMPRNLPTGWDGEVEYRYDLIVREV